MRFRKNERIKICFILKKEKTVLFCGVYKVNKK